MPQRLYYTDSYLSIFQAQQVAHSLIENRPAVALSESAFYPTSGGQPHDLGTLNGVPVLGVISDAEGTVWHITETPVIGEIIEGKIDWARRFDHMQQHTGQHVITRAFIEIADAETIGFHLSENTVTIDLDKTNLSDEVVDKAETLANQIIYENRPIKVWFPNETELMGLPLRKISEKVQGAVRVVDIDGFDITACGGTHVAHTGEVGIIKVLRLDKRGDLLRVEFCCGNRALSDYRQKNLLLNSLAAQMTTGYEQIPSVLDKLREENKTLNRDLKIAREQVLAYEVEALYLEATHPLNRPYKIIQRVFENRSQNELQHLAAQLAQRPQTVILLGLAGDKAHLVFARSTDLEIVDVVPLLKNALAQLGNARGGGRPMMAQGGGVAASFSQVEAALVQAVQTLGE